MSSVRNKSISSSSKPNSEVSSEYSFNIEVTSDKSIDNDDVDDDDDHHNSDVDDDVHHPHNDVEDNDDNEGSEVSIELNFDSKVMSSITSTLYPVANSMYRYESLIFDEKFFFLNIEPITTTDQISNNQNYHLSNNRNDHLSKKRNEPFSRDPETIIDGYRLRWPKFEIHNYFFEGN